MIKKISKTTVCRRCNVRIATEPGKLCKKCWREDFRGMPFYEQKGLTAPIEFTDSKVIS
jgi:ribosomal protein L40E